MQTLDQKLAEHEKAGTSGYIGLHGATRCIQYSSKTESQASSCASLWLMGKRRHELLGNISATKSTKPVSADGEQETLQLT